MYKKIISGSLVAVAVMLTGCGNDATTCRIDVQKAIDEGRYDDAIADMNGSCKTAFTKSDLDMNLASAYMGKSGYSVSNIADMLINSNDNSDNAFSSFITSVNNKKTENSNTLPLLNIASNYFKGAITDGNVTNATNICNDPEKIKNNARASNACLYIGFNDVIKSATTITYLTGDVNKLVTSIDNDNNSTPYDMLANMDALGWAVTKDYNSSNDANITATSIKIKGHSFANLTVSYKDHGTFYRLAKSMTQDINNSTVITDGYCDATGNKTACAKMINDNTTGAIINPIDGCYACPISFDTNSTDTDVAQLLVNTLNGGSDTIAIVSNDQDIKDSIDDFKKNITGSSDGNVTVQDIMDYLQK